MKIIVIVLFYGSLSGLLSQWCFWLGFVLYIGFDLGIAIGISEVVHKDKQGH